MKLELLMQKLGEAVRRSGHLAWAVKNTINSRGSAILDVTVALIILGLLGPALISLFNTSAVFAQYASTHTRALNSVQGVLEEIKALPKSKWGNALGGGEDFIRLDSGERFDHKDLMIALTSGPGEGQVRKVIGYDPETKTAFVEPAWITPPVQGKTNYVLLQDRPYCAYLQINTSPTSNNTRSITVSFSDQKQAVPIEISLTTDIPGW